MKTFIISHYIEILFVIGIIVLIFAKKYGV